jgi:hypothetical protein
MVWPLLSKNFRKVLRISEVFIRDFLVKKRGPKKREPVGVSPRVRVTFDYRSGALTAPDARARGDER